MRPQSPPSGLSCSSQPLHSSSPSVKVEQPPHCSVCAHHKSAALEQTENKERSTLLSTCFLARLTTAAKQAKCAESTFFTVM